MFEILSVLHIMVKLLLEFNDKIISNSAVIKEKKYSSKGGTGFGGIWFLNKQIFTAGGHYTAMHILLLTNYAVHAYKQLEFSRHRIYAVYHLGDYDAL